MLFDQTGIFQFPDALDDRRHRHIDFVADDAGVFAGIFAQTFENFDIDLIHFGVLRSHVCWYYILFSKIFQVKSIISGIFSKKDSHPFE